MIALKSQTLEFLDELEACIDPETEDDFSRQWRTFLDHQFTGASLPHNAKKESVCSSTANGSN